MQIALEGDSRAKLQGAWAARAEDLTGSAGRLTEVRHVAQVEAVTTQVGDVEDVEHFAEDRELVIFTPGESLRHADVLRTEPVPESIIGWQRQRRDQPVLGVSFARVSRVPGRDSLGQVILPATAVEAVVIQSWNRGCAVTVSVQINIRDCRRQRAAARH